MEETKKRPVSCAGRRGAVCGSGFEALWKPGCRVQMLMLSLWVGLSVNLKRQEGPQSHCSFVKTHPVRNFPESYLKISQYKINVHSL